MKKIIVLTDFSKTARNAANAAVEIACQLNANILLVNSYLLPFTVFAMEGEGRTLIDSSLISSVSETGLKNETRRLRRIIDAKIGLSKKILVESLSSIESIHQTMIELNRSAQVAMVVMGVHQSSFPVMCSAIDLESLLSLMDCPILILPNKHQGFPIKNFVFATNLADGDIAVLARMLSLAKSFDFHIHVCHVSKSGFVPDFNEEDKVQKFMHDTIKFNDRRISFTILKSLHIVKTLNEFSKSINADMIGIIYNPHSLGWKLFHQSHTSKIIKHQYLPLLIFPQHLSKKQ